MFALRIALAASLLLAPAAVSQVDILDLPTDVEIGEVYDTCLTSPEDSLAFLILSDGPGPFPTKYGVLDLDFPFLYVAPLYLTGGQPLCFQHLVHCEPATIDLTLHLQYIALRMATPGEVGISNPAVITIRDGVCIEPGDFATFTQGGWGAACNGNNAGCIRDAHFDEVFPNGMVLGDPDGADGGADGAYALVLTTSAAAEAYIPSGGPSVALTGDEVDPTSNVAGNLGGQMVAAMLNVHYDLAGHLDDLKEQDYVKLIDMTYFADCVHEDIAGLTVGEVLDAAHLLISGAETSIDTTGDGVGDVGPTEIAQALDVLNMNFDNGTQDDGCLLLP